tara:strand:- start:100 stop:348 length:249 start_codon:yes stop_codon:yes gene_type:complete
MSVLAVGYAQDNPLPTTLLRATVAMLAGLLLARWWGLTVRKQLAMIFLNDLKQKEETTSGETTENEEIDATKQATESGVAAE